MARCETKLVASLMTLLDFTADGLRDEEGLSAEEAEGVLDNVQSAALGACAHILRQAAATDKLGTTVVRLTEQLVGTGKLWALGGSKQWRVRAAAYEVIAAYLQHSLPSLEPHDYELTTFMQDAFGEASAEVHPALWPAVLLWVKNVPADWGGVASVQNLHGTFLQKLCGLLRKTSGIAGSQVTYGSLLPLLALLGERLFPAGEEKRGKDFVYALLISLWNGMRSPTLPVSEIPALISAWAECWVYLAGKAASALGSADFLVSEHLAPVLRMCLVSSFALPHRWVAERLCAALAKGPGIPGLAAPLLAMWTEVFDDLATPGAALVKPAAPAAPAPEAGGKKKKGKEASARLAYDTTEGDRFNSDPANALRRLSLLLECVGNAEVARAPDAEYRQEFALLLGTHLIGVLGSGGEDTDVRPLLACWRACEWGVVQQLLAKVYTDLLGAALRGRLGTGAAGRGGLWGRLGMGDLMTLAEPHLKVDDAEVVQLLRATGASQRPEECAALFEALPDGAGSEVGGALHDATLRVLSTCTTRGGDALPPPGADGQEPSAAEAWFGVLEHACALSKHPDTLRQVLEASARFLAAHHSLPALRAVLTIAERAVAVPADPALAAAWREVLVEVPVHLAKRAPRLSPDVDAVLTSWSEIAARAALGDVAADAEKRVTALVEAGAGHPPVCAKMYTAPALKGYRTLTLDLLDKLWAAAEGALPTVTLTEEAKDLAVLERAEWAGGGSLDAGAAAAWACAAETYALLHHEAPLTADVERAPLRVAMHHARFKLLAEAEAVGSDAHGVLCAENLEQVLLHPGAAEAVIRACVEKLEAADSLDYLAAVLIVREAAHLSEPLRRAVLFAAVPPLNGRARTVAEMATAWPAVACDGGDDAALAAHLLGWCQAVAERDEIGEDVSDADAAAALQLCLWAQAHLDAAAAAATLPGLEACAMEKLQPEDGAPPAAWDLRGKLAIARLLRSNAKEALPLTAALLQGYQPSCDFAWVPEEGACALPHAASMHGALARLLEVADEAADVDVGSRALLLSAAADVVTAGCRASLDSGDARRHTLDTASLKRLATDFVRYGSAEATAALLSPSWNTTVLTLFTEAVEAIIATEEEPGRMSPLTGKEEPPAPQGYFAQPMDGCGAVVALAAALARVNGDDAGAAAPAAEGESDMVGLPQEVEKLIGSLKGLQERLLPGTYPQSQVSIRLLFKLQRVVLQRPLLLQAYLTAWVTVLRLLEAASYASVDTPLASLKGAVLEALQDNGLMKPLMDIVGALLILPKDEAEAAMEARAASAFDDAEAVHDALPQQTDIPLTIRDTVLGITRSGVADGVAGSAVFLSSFGGLGDAGLAAVHLFSLLMSAVPASPRRWVNDCEGSLKEAIRTFVQRHLSPALIKKELDFVVQQGQGQTTFNPTDELKVRVLPASATVLLEYEYEDCTVSVKMVVPPAFPLEPIQHPALDAQATRAKAGLSVDVWRGWLMQMTAKLLNKSARLWNLVELWQQNLTKHFDGRHEPCPICYQIVNPTTHQLPALTCSTCGGKYHKLCLFKWFKQSNDSTCPLCRTAWYSGSAASAPPAGGL
eukprot:TRINITY_DN3031_c1_g1_i1.p1 TRINITY_DN3031_c1_g1~~TRINITY_DN3031_c1_g1_i1.p1  ORF type:complete len:1768 (+),score=698.33 TRINITY_DN3031_c1_g1_i1:582-5306(+)